jgi:hypothetical protein
VDEHRPTIEGTRRGDALLGPLHLKELNSVSLLRGEFLPPSYPVSYALAEAKNSLSGDITNYTYFPKNKIGISALKMYIT